MRNGSSYADLDVPDAEITAYVSVPAARLACGIAKPHLPAVGAVGKVRHEMTSDANPSALRKRQLKPDQAASADVANEIDIANCATIAYSSEDPACPVEYLLDARSGPGATRWCSARPDVTELLVLEFDRPQAISRLLYEVEETERERTQEVRVEVSEDRGRTYRQILVQDYTFSPRGATYQREEQRLNVHQASHLRFTIVPNKNGSGTATLTALRLFA